MLDQHDFAATLRTIGRGPKLSRTLSREEARLAMAAILDGQVDDLQLGAFLLLLRYRRETAEELAGMIDAVHERLPPAMSSMRVDLDWPSYADRHRQQPWFVLSALLLATSGVRVLMHGIEGARDGFAPMRPVLRALGVSLQDDAAALRNPFMEGNLAYVGLEQFAPGLERLFALRPRLGVRTAVNTLARALNPARAPVQLQGVFHPNYRPLHREVARLRGQATVAIFKGGAGEVQRNPGKPCRVAWLRDGKAIDEDWPALVPGGNYDWRSEDLSPARVVALWRGELAHPQAVAAVTGTAALALRALGRAVDQPSAQELAEELWAARDRSVVRPDSRLALT